MAAVRRRRVRLPRALLPVLLAVVATTLAACGERHSRGTAADAVRDTVVRFAEAVNAHSGRRACAELTAKSRAGIAAVGKERLKLDGCAATLDRAYSARQNSQPAPHLQRGDVDPVHISGTSATAAYSASGHRQQVALRRENGAWKIVIASFGG